MITSLSHESFRDRDLKIPKNKKKTNYLASWNFQFSQLSKFQLRKNKAEFIEFLILRKSPFYALPKIRNAEPWTVETRIFHATRMSLKSSKSWMLATTFFQQVKELSSRMAIILWFNPSNPRPSSSSDLKFKIHLKQGS